MAKGYLDELSPIHLQVKAALCDGKIYKLDGHTRAGVWSTWPESKQPQTLDATVFDCPTTADVVTLRHQIDSPESVKSHADAVYGALRYNNYTPKSAWLRKGQINNALSISYSTFNVGSSDWRIERDPLITATEFLPELAQLDAMKLTGISIKGGLITGQLLMLRRYGAEITSFFDLFNRNQGTKTEDVYDAVQALWQRINNLSKYRGSSSEEAIFIAGLVVDAGTAWMEKRDYPALSRGNVGVKTANIKEFLVDYKGRSTLPPP